MALSITIETKRGETSDIVRAPRMVLPGQRVQIGDATIFVNLAGDPYVSWRRCDTSPDRLTRGMFFDNRGNWSHLPGDRDPRANQGYLYTDLVYRVALVDTTPASSAL